MVQRRPERLPGLEPTAEVSHREPRDIIVSIEGLTPVIGEPNTFRLEGVMPVEIDPHAVYEVLENAGVPRTRAQRYTDELVEDVYRQELAYLIMERMTRIG